MKKSDIKRSYHQGHSGDPMINVKNHLWLPDLIRQYRTEGHEFSGDERFWTWVEETYDASTDYGLSEFNSADEWARELSWDLAQEYALEVWPQMTGRMVDEKKFFPDFPPGCQWRFTGEKVYKPEPVVRVWSAGRSGGWLVVSGLPDVDDWDAVALGQWAKFNKMIRGLADEGYPYDFVWQLHSLWERTVDEPREEAERWIDALATLT